MKFDLKLSKELIKTQRYKIDKKKLSSKKLILRANKLINEIGFCVIENIVSKEIKKISNEIAEAKVKNLKNTTLFKNLLKQNYKDKDLIKFKKLEIRKSKFSNRPYKLVNDIFWLPKFSKYLPNDDLISILESILDKGLRIGQLHSKYDNSSQKIYKDKILGKDSFGLPKIIGGNSSTRDWHTDWPHDPWAYGGGNKNENIGFLNIPFKDIAMGLIVIHYFTDTSKGSGTWVIPKSHKSGYSPRDGRISLFNPIPEELQITSKAGSILIQDTRLWHSTPITRSNEERAIVVSRWYPWWLQIDDYASTSRFNIVCRPLSKNDFDKLPKKLKPFMQHLCNQKHSFIGDHKLKLSKKYIDKSIKNLSKSKNL